MSDVGRPKPLFFVMLGLVVLGLAAYSYYHFDIFAPKGATNDQQVSKDVMDKVKSPSSDYKQKRLRQNQ